MAQLRITYNNIQINLCFLCESLSSFGIWLSSRISWIALALYSSNDPPKGFLRYCSSVINCSGTVPVTLSRRRAIFRNNRALAWDTFPPTPSRHGPTYAPVVSFTAIRLLFSIAAYENMLVYYLDIDNAFLNGNLEETVYMHQPLYFADSDNPYGVCKLHKSIYGLKQAARC